MNEGRGESPGNKDRAAADEAIEAFLTSLKAERNLSGNTVRAYGADLRSYRDWCERSGADPIRPTRRELRAYLGYLNAAGYARSTVNRRLSAVRGLFGWLVIAGRAPSDPTTTLGGLKRGERLPRKISAGEMRRILAVHGPHDLQGNARPQDAGDLRDQAVLELLYASGCRISEASGLRLGDIDFPGSQVKVFGKGGKERIIPLHALSIASLEAYLRCGRPALRRAGASRDWLFLSSRGNRYSSDAMRKMFAKTLALAGVSAGYTPHDMRHTFASDMLEGGAGLRTVQELLGHASPSTTQIYTHLSPGYLREAHRSAHPRA